MYLKGLYIENNGPLRSLTFDLPFTADGRPKPVVLVGGNGSGKTNLLSIVVDALIEAAAENFQDIVPKAGGMERPWFRIAGGMTITMGAQGSVTLLRFEHENKAYFFKEKAGKVLPDDVKKRVSDIFHPAIEWPEEGTVKDFNIPGDVATTVFESGVYVYFPSSRAEVPHWMNRESLSEAGFDISPKYTGRLRKPIYLERSLKPLKQWLLALLLDARADIEILPDKEGGPISARVLGDPLNPIANRRAWEHVNNILRAILENPAVRLGWRGRQRPGLGIATGQKASVPDLDGLSAGQSTLLSMFATLVRYADNLPANVPPSLPEIKGMCLIDEIDAHMHIDLQHKVLPSLIKMFPRMQFVVSTHSPLFVLGMESAFGADGVAVIELPSGTAIDAEAYAEFGRALDLVRQTKAFTRIISETASKPGNLLVLVEGETDSIYYRTAAQLSGRDKLLKKADIKWVGAKDPNSGQRYNTGANGLKNTYNSLRSNTQIIARPVLLVYDNDKDVAVSDLDKIFVRSVPGEPKNAFVKVGIESLLPDEVFTPEMFNERTERHDNGKVVNVREVKKMDLCRYVCETRRNATDFEGFSELLDMLEKVVETTVPHQGDERISNAD